MMYPVLVTLTLLSVWGTVAYMSVCGLMTVFSGHPYVAACLAAGLELGKLLAIVHLHRNWKSHGWTARFFYTFVIAALVCVTSIEATGYLIQSHMASSAAISSDRAALEALVREEGALRHRIDVIDNTVDQLPTGYVSRRINERKQAGYAELQNRLADNLAEQKRLSVGLVASTATAGPVAALAGVVNMPESKIILWFVLLVVCITEPLSIGLAVAASSAWISRRRKAAEKNTEKPADGQNESAAESGQNGQTEAAETENRATAKTAETQQDIEIIKTAETGRTGQNEIRHPAESGQNDPDELSAIVNRYNLTAEKLAKITGRRKLSTVRAWIDGKSEIPVKALRELRKWCEDRPRLVAVRR